MITSIVEKYRNNIARGGDGGGGGGMSGEDRDRQFERDYNLSRPDLFSNDGGRGNDSGIASISNQQQAQAQAAADNAARIQAERAAYEQQQQQQSDRDRQFERDYNLSRPDLFSNDGGRGNDSGIASISNQQQAQAQAAADNAARIQAERAAYEQQQQQQSDRDRQFERDYNLSRPDLFPGNNGGGGGITNLIPAPELPGPISGFDISPGNIVRAGDVPISDFNKISADYNRPAPSTGTGQFYGTEGQVGEIPSGKTPSFFNMMGGYTVNPNTVGMPSILSSTGSPILTQAPGPLRSTSSYVPSINIPYGEVPYFASEKGMNRPFVSARIGDISNLSPTTPQQDAINTVSGKLIFGESGGKNLGQHSKASSASGLAGFTDGTWISIVEKTPSLLSLTDGTRASILALKSDPQAQLEGTRVLTEDNARALANNNIPVTEGSLYSAHFLGPTGATKLYQASDDQSAKELLPDAARTNPSIITDTTTVGDLKNWADRKMSSVSSEKANDLMASLSGAVGSIGSAIGSAVSDLTSSALQAPATFANTLESALNSFTSAKNVPTPTPVDRTLASTSYVEAGSDIPASRTYTVDTMPKGSAQYASLLRPDVVSDVVPQDTVETGNERDNEFLRDYNLSRPDLFQDSSKSAVKAATENPQTFGDWLDSIFGTKDQVAKLEDQGRTALFPDSQPTDEDGNPISVKEWYASQYANGDVSKVKSRIVDFGQGPVVDYYVKGLDEVLGDIITGPFKAVGSLFGGSTAAPSEESGIKSIPVEGRGEGRGSSDRIVQAQAPAPVTPAPTIPPASIPVAELPPTYTTGMDLRRRRYAGNPLVEYGNVSSRYSVPYSLT